MTNHNYSCYACMHCSLAITNDSNFPEHLTCTCYPVRGQYVEMFLNGESVGTILITSQNVQAIDKKGKLELCCV